MPSHDHFVGLEVALTDSFVREDLRSIEENFVSDLAIFGYHAKVLDADPVFDGAVGTNDAASDQA